MQVFAYKRWTAEEVSLLKQLYIEGKTNSQDSKNLWQTIAKALSRKPSEVRRKIIDLYKVDQDLANYKQNSWSREKIIEQLVEIYLSGQPFNLVNLPSRLRFILLKSVPSTSKQSKAYFNSLDEALAEAALICGYARNQDGTLNYEAPLENMQQALEYVVLNNKKRHPWSLDEIKQILLKIHSAGFPITLSFLTNHFNLYQNIIGLNRKLESFKDVIKKFIADGNIKSYPDLVCTIAPEYIAYYNSEKTRLNLSTEEIRVKKFLDNHKIPYIIPKLSQKLPTGLAEFANVVPDFVILDDKGLPKAIVEVFGSIGDRENAEIDKIYKSKTDAKIKFYKSIPDIIFIEIYNNQGRCDLSDEILSNKFQKLKQFQTKIASSLEDIICNKQQISSVLNKFALAIVYNNKQNNYTLYTQSGLDFKFDKLEQLPLLSSKIPTLKTLLEQIKMVQNQDPYYAQHGKRLMPAEHLKDYKPIEDYTHNNKHISTSYGVDGTGPVG